eukprot:403352114
MESFDIVDPALYVDGNSQQNIELGTNQFPFRMLDDAIREAPYEYGESNETHATITIYDQGYYRNNTVFNPTLYPNSTPIPYNYQKQIDQGLMTFGESQMSNLSLCFSIVEFKYKM